MDTVCIHLLGHSNNFLFDNIFIFFSSGWSLRWRVFSLVWLLQRTMSDNIMRRIAATVTAATSSYFHLVFSIVVIIFQFRLVRINYSSDDDALRPSSLLTNFSCIGSVLTSISFVLGEDASSCTSGIFELIFFYYFGLLLLLAYYSKST